MKAAASGSSFDSILRLRLPLDGEASSPCGNLAARICSQILAERIDIFNINPP
jgi:hypothetical protein